MVNHNNQPQLVAFSSDLGLETLYLNNIARHVNHNKCGLDEVGMVVVVVSIYYAFFMEIEPKIKSQL